MNKIIINNQKCSGCYACYSVCSTQAITMIPDKFGFVYPKINSDLCVSCGSCAEVCPIEKQTELQNEAQTAYAAYLKNTQLKKESSSGGLFTAFANYVFSINGVVVGAAFDNDFRKVRHIIISAPQDLFQLRGSKYLQSEINDTFKSIKSILKEGRVVLFCGTPCQVHGLISYIGKNTENLYTVDLACHGVPSPLIWSKYVQYRENKAVDKVKNVDFRVKLNGWRQYYLRIRFQNKSDYIMRYDKDLYMEAFLRNYCLRSSCYNCENKGNYRYSDITIADFWGIEKVVPGLDDNQGTSLVITNSTKGETLFSAVKSQIRFEKCDFDQAITYNPAITKSSKKPSDYQLFWTDLQTRPIYSTLKKYCHDSLLKKVISKCHRINNKMMWRKNI